MSLKYIIDTVCEKLGYDAETQRTLVVAKINRAAKEVYELQDLPGCLREITLEATPELILALPYFIGELRAMRRRESKMKIELLEVSPNYCYNAWPLIWNNWRLLRKSPLQTSIVDASVPITFSMAEVEAEDVTVIVTGATENSARVTEEIIFTAGETEVDAANLFTEIHSITKNEVNTQNITLTGSDGDGGEVTLAVIPNDRLSSVYTLVDISKLPSNGDVPGSTAWYVEVLYKAPLFYLNNDGDEFICEGFDDAIVYKTCELDFAEKDGGGDKSIGFYQKCNQVIFNRINASNGGTQKELIFAPNQYLGMFPKDVPYYRTPWFGVSR